MVNSYIELSRLKNAPVTLKTFPKSRFLKRIHFLFQGTSTSSSDDSSIGAVNAVPDGSSVVACLLTMAATSPDPPPVPNIVTTPPEGEGGNNIQQQFATAQPEIQPQHKTPANPPRFTFFDYSLIPDKDPRAFGQKPKVK